MLKRQAFLPATLGIAALVLSGSLWLNAADREEAATEVQAMSADQLLKLKGMLADKPKMESIRDDIAKDDPETQEIRESINREHVGRLLMRDKEVSSKVRDIANSPEVARRKADHAKLPPLDDDKQMRRLVKEMAIRDMMHGDHADDMKDSDKMRDHD